MPPMIGARRALLTKPVRSIVASASTFAMSQLAAVNRIYQRDTMLGGGQNKGRGVIPVSINVTSAGAVYARIRDADGSTILQAGYQAATVIAPGVQTVIIGGIDARLGWIYVDLSGDGVTWQNGTVLVAMGSLVLMSGQSMVARFFQETVDTTTLVAAGVTAPANGRVFASIETSNAAPTAWVQPTDASTINGAGAAELLTRLIAVAGVNVGLVTKCQGSTSIEQWQIGQTLGDGLINTMAAAGGKFERVVWWQGHSNSASNTTAQSYITSLDTLWAGINAANSYAAVSRYVASIPNIASTNWGSVSAKEAIRRASYDWAVANGAIPILMADIEMNPDGVHAMQIGSKRMARHIYRAMRPSFGLAHNDNGATLGNPTHAVGSASVVIPFTLAAGATGLFAVGNPETRIKVYKAGDRFTPLAYASSNPITIDNVAKTITITLAADPGQISLDILPFGANDNAVDGSASMIYDDLVDGDGLTQGRHIFPGVYPLTIRVASDLTLTSPVYGTGYFGQTMTSGKGLSSHIVPDPSRGFTLEGWLRVDTVSSSTHIFAGSDKCIWIACANNDLKVQCGTGAQGSYAGVLPTGTWVHVAVVVPPLATAATVYVNGVAQGTTTVVANLQQASQFGIRCGGGFGVGFDLTTFGSEDHVALFEGARYFANFTPPNAPYTGSENKLVALWHLDGSGVNSKAA